MAHQDIEHVLLKRLRMVVDQRLQILPFQKFDDFIRTDAVVAHFQRVDNVRMRAQRVADFRAETETTMVSEAQDLRCMKLAQQRTRAVAKHDGRQ